MRKADYITLAELIRDELRTYRPLSSGAARVDSLERVARQFAQRASVNGAAFLKACGID